MTKILLCGVGGQGTILAANVLADAAQACGLAVKVSEIHGMAQRGGAVSTMISFGPSVTSMVIGQGEADIVMAFEKMEALRNVSTLRAGGHLIVNDEVIKPASVLTGKTALPENLDEQLFARGAVVVPAEAAAREAGSAKAANVVLLGVISALLPFSQDAWNAALGANVPSKTIQINQAAFAAGCAFAAEHLESAKPTESI